MAMALSLRRRKALCPVIKPFGLVGRDRGRSLVRPLLPPSVDMTKAGMELRISFQLANLSCLEKS